MSLYSQLDKCVVPCHLEDSVQTRGFLPRSDLDDWITIQNIKAQFAFGTRIRFPGLADKILQQAKRVFAILILIEEPWAIRDLIYRDKISDDDLPLCRNGDRGEQEYNVLASPGSSKRFESFKSWPKESSIREFLEKQWFVQAPVLDIYGMHMDLDKQCPLPLTECVTKAQGGSGLVHMARLHPAHHRLFPAGTEPYIAIKEMKDRDSFNKERTNLEAIDTLQHKHLTKLIATCEKESVFYLIFPWADGGTLRDFWKREDGRDRTPSLRLWALRQMLGLVDAIRALHAENIRHGDIKPQNILLFINSNMSPDKEGILVLADVGASRIHKQITILRNMATSTRDATISYEAPEAESDQLFNRPRTRRYDIWSTGCMFLEFVVWLVHRWKAVREFRRCRTKTDDPTIPGNFFTRKSEGFLQLHAAVHDTFESLRQDPCCKSGTALGDLLAVIEERLLQIEATQRAKASELYERLKDIIDQAEREDEYLDPPVDSSLALPRFLNQNESRKSASEVGTSP